MATAAMELETPQDDPPFGTCRVAGGSLWWVKGNSGWHLVNADTGECDCGNWVFGCRFRHNLCTHGDALKEHIEGLLACPVCRGARYLIPSGLIDYVLPDGSRDEGPWPCVECSGGN